MVLLVGGAGLWYNGQWCYVVVLVVVLLSGARQWYWSTILVSSTAGQWCWSVVLLVSGAGQWYSWSVVDVVCCAARAVTS